MQTTAIILSEPFAVGLDLVTLRPRASTDLLVDVEWSGISTGTERLLWSGRMPSFPGMGVSARARVRNGWPRHRLWARHHNASWYTRICTGRALFRRRQRIVWWRCAAARR